MFNAEARYKQALNRLMTSQHATPTERQHHADDLRQACENYLREARATGTEPEARAALASDWAGLESESVVAEMLRLAAPCPPAAPDEMGGASR